MPGYIDTPMTRSNPYPMPFLLTAEDAARRMARIIEAGRRQAVIPWQMALVARVLRWMPSSLFDLVFSRAPHKPRKGP
jgi:short-subunit dehydrogenase